MLPAGNLGNTAAFGKALHEAYAWGLIPRLPRLAAVQAAGAAPFAQSFAEGFARRYTVRAETVATAIRIGDPASYQRAVRAIRETDGVVLAVDDDAILAAKAAVDACGVGCEPASAASVAGVRSLVAQGTIASPSSGSWRCSPATCSRIPAPCCSTIGTPSRRPRARTGRSRSRRTYGRWSGSWESSGSAPAYCFRLILQIFPFASAARKSEPSAATASPLARSAVAFGPLAKVTYFPVALPSTKGAKTTR